MIDGKHSFVSIICTLSTVPNQRRLVIARSKNFITYTFEIGIFNIINTNKNRAVLGQQLLQQFQARIHHAQPLVMAAQVLALFADRLVQPVPHARVVYVVVIHPALVAGVVRWIYIDALDLPLVLRQQCLQCLQIVAMNNFVGTAVIGLVLSVLVKAVLPFQYPIRHFQMVVDYFVLANPCECRHFPSSPCRAHIPL